MSTLASIRRTPWEVKMDLLSAVPGAPRRVTLYAHPVSLVYVLSTLVVLGAAGMAADPVSPIAPIESLSFVQWLAGVGPQGLLVVLVLSIVFGKLRTSQEIEAYARRAERAETQLDAMMPRIDRMLETTEALLRDRTRVP